MHRRPIRISALSDELNEPKFLLLLLARPFSFFTFYFAFILWLLSLVLHRLATATVSGKIKHFFESSESLVNDTSDKIVYESMQRPK